MAWSLLVEESYWLRDNFDLLRNHREFRRISNWLSTKNNNATELRERNSVVICPQSTLITGLYSVFLRLALRVAEERLKRYKTESSCSAQSLHAVVYLQLLVDVCQVEVNCSF
jgi:hypothetical protein